MEIFVIVNPVAGNRRSAHRIRRLEAFLQQHPLVCEWAFTRYKGHAIELAATAVQKGCRHIIAVGGDGTANEVANGILRQPEGNQVCFSLYPVGTGNDWIRTHGIPHNPDQWFDMFLRQKSIYQDAGTVRCYHDGQPIERFFINVAGMSYDAYVVEQIEKAHVKASNKFRYLWWILKCLFRFRLPHASLQYNGQTVQDFFYTINAGICRFSGGGMQFVPHAIPDDGLLALTYARRVPKWELILQTPRFFDGSIVRHPQLATAQTDRIGVVATSGHTLLIETDGELIGASPIEIGILPKALRIIVP